MHFKYIFFIMYLFVIGCNSAPPNVQSKKHLYYCAVFEQGGTRLITDYRINSFDDIEEEKKKLLDGYDGLFYEVMHKVNSKEKLIKGYSIRTKELEKIMKTDKEGRVTSIEYPKAEVKCSKTYLFRNKNFMQTVKTCNNGDKIIDNFTREKINSYINYKKTRSYFYKNENLVKRVSYKNGIAYQFDIDGHMKGQAYNIALSDLCTPTIQYAIGKIVGM